MLFFSFKGQKEERSHQFLQQLFLPTSWHWRWAWKEVTMALCVRSLNGFSGKCCICIETLIALKHSFTYISKLFCLPIFKSLKWPLCSDRIRIESLPEAGLGLSVVVCVYEFSCCSRKKYWKILKMGPVHVFNHPSYSYQKDFFSTLIFFPISLLISLSCW